MRISHDCWQCEYGDCAHIWLVAKEEPPEQCAKCRRRGWNANGTFVAGQAPVKKPREARVKKEPAPNPPKPPFVYRNRKGKAESSPEKPPVANRVRDLLAVPGVTTGNLLSAQYQRPAHDPKTCRLQGCGMCAAAKGEKG